MKKTNCLLGCAIGCGAVLLIGVILAVTGTMFVRDSMKGFDEAIGTRHELDERFGTVDSFTPWPGGAVPADRIEAFLAVREATAPTRDRVAGTISKIETGSDRIRETEDQPFFRRMAEIARIGSAPFDLGAELGNLFQSRNDALLEHGMGLGEYSYLYAVSYYSWLGHLPSKEPSRVRIGVGTGRGRRRTDHGGPDRLQKELLTMLLNALPESPGAEAEDDELDAWHQALEEEIERMESDRKRYPWQDGLPDVMSASLEPYRDRLEATFSPETDGLELTRNQRKGSWGIQAD